MTTDIRDEEIPAAKREEPESESLPAEALRVDRLDKLVATVKIQAVTRGVEESFATDAFKFFDVENSGFLYYGVKLPKLSERYSTTEEMQLMLFQLYSKVFMMIPWMIRENGTYTSEYDTYVVRNKIGLAYEELISKAFSLGTAGTMIVRELREKLSSIEAAASSVIIGGARFKEVRQEFILPTWMMSLYLQKYQLRKSEFVSLRDYFDALEPHFSAGTFSLHPLDHGVRQMGVVYFPRAYNRYAQFAALNPETMGEFLYTFFRNRFNSKFPVLLEDLGKVQNRLNRQLKINANRETYGSNFINSLRFNDFPKFVIDMLAASVSGSVAFNFKFSDEFNYTTLITIMIVKLFVPMHLITSRNRLRMNNWLGRHVVGVGSVDDAVDNLAAAALGEWRRARSSIAVQILGRTIGRTFYYGAEDPSRRALGLYERNMLDLINYYSGRGRTDLRQAFEILYSAFNRSEVLSNFAFDVQTFYDNHRVSPLYLNEMRLPDTEKHVIVVPINQLVGFMAIKSSYLATHQRDLESYKIGLGVSNDVLEFISAHRLAARVLTNKAISKRKQIDLTIEMLGEKNSFTSFISMMSKDQKKLLTIPVDGRYDSIFDAIISSRVGAGYNVVPRFALDYRPDARHLRSAEGVVTYYVARAPAFVFPDYTTFRRMPRHQRNEIFNTARSTGQSIMFNFPIPVEVTSGVHPPVDFDVFDRKTFEVVSPLKVHLQTTPAGSSPEVAGLSRFPRFVPVLDALPFRTSRMLDFSTIPLVSRSNQILSPNGDFLRLTAMRK